MSLPTPTIASPDMSNLRFLNVSPNTPISLPVVWPEPVHRVQTIAESGINTVPSPYVRAEADRPALHEPVADIRIPVVDISGLSVESMMETTLADIGHACQQWGFFQVVNHGIPCSLLKRVKTAAKQFFKLPLKDKQVYANNPCTYEGYGSRLGVVKGAALDWGDYFFFNFLPPSMTDTSKWPSKPVEWRETMVEYLLQVEILCHKLLGALSCNLGLDPCTLEEAFGGKSGCEMSVRINYYPACPQPELTLGLSSHSDPGGITVLLQDDDIDGLQVRHDGRWVAVKSHPGALTVNIADQIQILTNRKYKSVDHRVLVNKEKERLSVACFFNPGNEELVAPLKQLVTVGNPPQYEGMTFRQYRSFIRTEGTKGKEHMNSILSPNRSKFAD